MGGSGRPAAASQSHLSDKRPGEGQKHQDRAAPLDLAKDLSTSAPCFAAVSGPDARGKFKQVQKAANLPCRYSEAGCLQTWRFHLYLPANADWWTHLRTSGEPCQIII